MALFKAKNFIGNFLSKLVGVNCHFDPFVSLETVKKMKQGLEEAGLVDKVYLMCQPLAYHTPDAGKQGFIDLPEFPFSLEPRICTRWVIHSYARQAYELGVRYLPIILPISSNKSSSVHRHINDYPFLTQTLLLGIFK